VETGFLLGGDLAKFGYRSERNFYFIFVWIPAIIWQLVRTYCLNQVVSFVIYIYIFIYLFIYLFIPQGEFFSILYMSFVS